jgi:hypothetical protein
LKFLRSFQKKVTRVFFIAISFPLLFRWGDG